MKNVKQGTSNTAPLLSWILAACVAGMIAAPVALADSQTGGFEPVVVSDDIMKRTTEVERAGGESDVPASPDEGAGADGGSDSAPSGSDDGGQGNNGHGNNEDGSDVSNPGQGGGGPHASDASGDVDDESKGGGASPSKDKSNNGKSNKK